MHYRTQEVIVGLLKPEATRGMSYQAQEIYHDGIV